MKLRTIQKSLFKQNQEKNGRSGKRELLAGGYAGKFHKQLMDDNFILSDRRLFFVIALCLGFTSLAGAYDVINIDLNGGASDPLYNGSGPFGNPTWITIDEWNGYYQGEGVMMTSPRCVNIGEPGGITTYGRAVFIADPCAHSYLSGGAGELLGDGFVSDYTGAEPNLFPKLYIYGNWAYGGLFDVYILAAGAPGSFTIRDGKGNIQSGSLTGAGDQSSWNPGQNYVKFTDVWIEGTNTRDANGLIADYLNNDEYLTDPNCAVIGYNGQIDGIQLASVKRHVRGLNVAEPCIVYVEVGIGTRKKVRGQWPADTPTPVINNPLTSNRTNLLCADYDAAYENNGLAGEYDLDGPDCGWAIPDETLIGFIDEDWAKRGYNTYINSGEWMEYDLIVTPETKGLYTVRGLVNCWSAEASIGVCIDNTYELGTLTQKKYSDMSPPINDPNAVVWSENYVNFNLFIGLHKFKWKQNGAYCNILGFQISYIGSVPIEVCEDVKKHGLELDGDINGDCYVNFADVKVLTDNWLRTGCAAPDNCGGAGAWSIYAGGSDPGIVYRHLGGTFWETVSQELGDAVLCLCQYNGHLYAGTLSTSSQTGRVWRYEEESTNWTLVGDNLDNQVCSLIVFRGNLYAGTAWGSGKLYRYDGDNNWTNVVDLPSWLGFRSMYVWNNILYIGDIGYDLFGHYDEVTFTFDADLGGSCIWDHEDYDSNLYSSAYQGSIHRSSDGTTWTTIRGYQDYSDSWEMETLQEYLYVTTGPTLERYDGNEFSPVWTEPDRYEIISMISTGDVLILGTGKEAGSGYAVPGIGRVYVYDGNEINLISGNMGSGIQSLYAQGQVQSLLDSTKVDNVNDGDWLRPGDEITYAISYGNPVTDPCEPMYVGTVNDVNIIDYLPAEVDFKSASGNSGNWSYNLNPHTVIWPIGTIQPGDANSVTLTVEVKGNIESCSIITNHCVIKGGQVVLSIAYQQTAAAQTGEDVYKCGWSLPGDLNGDCIVNFLDFVDIAKNWWQCNEPSDESCEKPWLK